MGKLSSLDDSALPLSHSSTVRVCGALPHSKHEALENETPLFAAEWSFARERGGPITRAFLEALPLDREDGVVVDSSLVWLAPGLAHGLELAPGGRVMGPRRPVRFLHEPFPGISTGVRGESNRNIEAIHWMAILGQECTPEVAEGDLVFSDAAEAEAFWLPGESFDARESDIERRLATGRLVRRPIPLGTIVEFGWGTLMRARPAATTGFQFVLRATIRDRRPYVNGFRNLSML